MDDKIKIVVFGSSTCLPESARYREAEELGRGLAESGFGVVTGGYGGTMEAVSKGAATVNTVQVEGVVVPELFPNRPASGNKYLNEVTPTRTLMGRLARLMDASNIYIALPGSVGTLGEVAIVWNHISIDFRVRNVCAKHLLVWRKPFALFFEHAVTDLGLTGFDMQNIHFVDNVAEALVVVRGLLEMR